MRCPCCGANLIYKGKMKVCEYCGYEEKDTSAQKDYNVLIEHLKGTANVFNISIPDAHIKFVTCMNQTQSLKLVPGPHTIHISMGNYRKTQVIVVPDNDEIVKISIWYDSAVDGTLHVKIDQPKVDAKYDLQGGLFPAKKTTLTTVSFILAMTMVAPIPAIILAGIDNNNAKKAGRRPHYLSTVALVVSYLVFCFWLMIMSVVLKNS